jgi:hypothetical protein
VRDNDLAEVSGGRPSAFRSRAPATEPDVIICDEVAHASGFRENFALSLPS